MAKRPAHKITPGRGLDVSIWENEGQNGSYFTVTVERSYKKDDKFKSTSTLRRDDLLIVQKAFDEAHSWILEAEKAQEGA